ncbi:hypothetical protein [Myceligenerans pegani]|uniref:GerMN domain-containing protein n=1 Tax=Myceligenerans pegani TaxID=2776917 RepID=A0ABR9N4N1_9MICO|nr:hypothetical protein [Myceligenerans sp. TRM 65318]MBE1878231.1 hypothetical protein [Myceligenerans sp. TRM 65318]MBE3020502.1 hypothetical protein [Myceligenerans sp. TRM 65318]
MSDGARRGTPVPGAVPAVLVAVAVLLAGCGVPPSGVIDGGRAPTGVAPGPTLYFVGPDGELVAQTRDTGRLGTISDALALLLTGTQDPALRTGITSGGTTRVGVTHDGDTIELHLPLAEYDVTPRGLDQIACTALATHVQAGGSADTRVRVLLTVTEPGSDAGEPRGCPVVGRAAVR